MDFRKAYQEGAAARGERAREINKLRDRWREISSLRLILDVDMGAHMADIRPYLEVAAETQCARLRSGHREKRFTVLVPGFIGNDVWNQRMVDCIEIAGAWVLSWEEREAGIVEVVFDHN